MYGIFYTRPCDRRNYKERLCQYLPLEEKYSRENYLPKTSRITVTHHVVTVVVCCNHMNFYTMIPVDA